MLNIRQRLKEEFLLHIWDEGHLALDQLCSTDGQRIEILFKGRWNVDSGPDFRNAILKFAGELRKGDIEIHFESQDWYAHGHHLDPRYNEVILHVVFQEGSPSPTVTASGRHVPVLILGNFLDESISRLRAKVIKKDTPGIAKWPDHCILARKNTLEKRQVLEGWGLIRLSLKKNRFREERDFFELNELLYQGICEALGYSKNRKPFLKLALSVGLKQALGILQDIRNEDDALLKLQGLYFGTAGLLPESEKLPYSILQFVQRLKFQFGSLPGGSTNPKLRPEEWQFFRLRPQNFPTVRLAGLCRLLWQRRKTGFLEPILSAYRSFSNRPARLFSELVSQFCVESFGFWRNHYYFEHDVRFATVPRAYHLIGRNKSREIVVNVVLPIVALYAEETEDLELADLNRQVYLQAPKLERNQLTKKICKQLQLAPSEQKNMGACHQQGMIFLAKEMCPNWYCGTCGDPSSFGLE